MSNPRETKTLKEIEKLENKLETEIKEKEE